MDYEKKYKEALERARQFSEKPYLEDSKGIVDYIFPELKESEDERIRKELLAFVIDMDCKESWIAWLEKQGEQKPCMIQWKGDNLKEVIGFTGKDKNFEKWFTSFEEYEKYVHEHNDIFKLFNEDGSHYEVPVGAWIVKTPDGYNVASKAVLKQKTIDKVRPKFHEGEWITNGDYTWKIVEVKPLDYILQSQDGNIVDDTISHVDEQFHSFSIEDAKDCDVLCTYECCEPKIVFILKGIPKKHYALSYHCYYNIMYTHFESDSKKGCLAPNDEDVKPATKEQRDTLFAKMREEGYEWDTEKKELKGIEQKPAWSEEDEEMLNVVIESCEKCGNEYAYYWLKSLKNRYTWKPSDEQLEALIYVVNLMASSESPTENDYYYNVFKDLIKQLKKLMEE